MSYGYRSKLQEKYGQKKKERYKNTFPGSASESRPDLIPGNAAAVAAAEQAMAKGLTPKEVTRAALAAMNGQKALPAPPQAAAPQAPAAAASISMAEEDLAVLRKVAALDVGLMRNIALLQNDQEEIIADLKRKRDSAKEVLEGLKSQSMVASVCLAGLASVSETAEELGTIVDVVNEAVDAALAKLEHATNRGVYYNGTNAELFELLDESELKHGCDERTKKAELKRAFKEHILGD